MSNPIIDLNGVLNVQKDYLLNLKSQSQNSASAGVISDIQTNLQNLYGDYTNSNQTTDGLLTQQTNVLNIVNTENQRLEDKKDSVDKILTGKKRAADLNNSARLRQNAYTNLLIVFIITLGLFIGIIILSRTFPFIPQSIFDILSIIVISIGIFVGIYLFLDIQTRSKMNYDQLDLPGINKNVAGNTLATGTDTGNLLDLINISGCVGSDCCGPNTTWDQGNSKCSSVSISGFTTMDVAYNKSELSKITPNSAFEFSNYVLLN
jgi:hypothetical protein